MTTVLWMSDLDTWQAYRSNLIGRTALLNRMSRLDTLPPIALAGRDFATICEHADLQIGTMEWEAEEDITIPCYPVREQSVKLVLNGVELRGRLDGVSKSGMTVADHKVTTKPSMERLMESWQWRAYLAASPRAKRFVYHVFHVRRRGARRWLVKARHDLTLYPYPSLMDDVARIALDMASGLRALGWTGYRVA